MSEEREVQTKFPPELPIVNLMGELEIVRLDYEAGNLGVYRDARGNVYRIEFEFAVLLNSIFEEMKRLREQAGVVEEETPPSPGEMPESEETVKNEDETELE